MVLLVLASLWSWAIIFNKWIALGALRRKAAKFEKIFWSGQSLDELYQQFAAKNDHPLASVSSRPCANGASPLKTERRVRPR